MSEDGAERHPELADIVSARWRHLRLLRRHGPAVTYDVALTGFLICGHLWGYQPGEWPRPWLHWTRRAQFLIPPGHESSHFTASRIFAAAHPEAVTLACLIASPAWRGLAAGGPASSSSSSAGSGGCLAGPATSPAISMTRSRTG